MYTPIGIQQLSNAQIKKLLSGGRVRVKSGSAHQIQMVQEHAKKLASAAKKGAGIMLQLDPYACDLNREGCGVGSKMKAGFKKLGSFVKGNKEAFRPLASSLKQAAHQSIADASMSALDDYNLDPSLVNAYAQLAHQAVQGQGVGKKITKLVRSPAVKTIRKAFRPLAQKAFEDAQDVALAGLDMATQQAMAGLSAPSGQGIGKKITKFVRSPAVKTIRKAFRPLAQQAFEDAQDVAFAGLDMAKQQAMAGLSAPSGQGIGKKITKLVRSPAVKTIRKAFRPLAQKAFEDAQDVAFAGLDMAKQQALGSMSAPSGMGLRRAKGGALFPAGGALFPAGMVMY